MSNWPKIPFQGDPEVFPGSWWQGRGATAAGFWATEAAGFPLAIKESRFIKEG